MVHCFVTARGLQENCKGKRKITKEEKAENNFPTFAFGLQKRFCNLAAVKTKNIKTLKITIWRNVFAVWNPKQYGKISIN